MHDNDGLWVSPSKTNICIDGGCAYGGQLNALLISDEGVILEQFVVKNDSIEWLGISVNGFTTYYYFYRLKKVVEFTAGRFDELRNVSRDTVQLKQVLQKHIKRVIQTTCLLFCPQFLRRIIFLYWTYLTELILNILKTLSNQTYLTYLYSF